jgi:hypothetical protein
MTDVEAGVRTIGAAVMIGIVACAEPLAAQDVARQQDHYQISQMERMLEGAVEHGAAVIRDRLQSVMPSEVLISQNARARGFRLEGYGIFFDVAVPSLQGTMPWIFRTLDQNDLGLATALSALRAHVDADGDEKLQEALQRIELQLAPIAPAPTAPPANRGPNGAAVPVAAAQNAATPPASDDILNDPREAFHNEVRQDVVDALLEYASSLGVAPTEWVSVALRTDDELPLVGPADNADFTMVLRVRGSDLAASRTGALTKDAARERVEARVF